MHHVSSAGILVTNASWHLLRRVIGHAAKMARCLAEQGISNFLQVMKFSCAHALQPCLCPGRTGPGSHAVTYIWPPATTAFHPNNIMNRTPHNPRHCAQHWPSAGARNQAAEVCQTSCPLAAVTARITHRCSTVSCTVAGAFVVQVSQEARKALGPTAASDSNWFTGGSVLAWPGEKVR